MALTIRSDGSQASAEVLGYLNKLRPMAFATYLYGGAGQFLGGIGTTSGDFGALGRRVYVDANAGGQNIHFESHEEFDSNSYGGMSVTVQGTGLATLLLIGAGDFSHWTWTFEGGPGVSLEAIATGDRAFRYVERDFKGPANIGAWNVGGAHVSAEVTRSFEIADTWIGGFSGSVNDTAERLSLTTPAGQRTCACSMVHFEGPNRAGPGSYMGKITGAGAANVFLWGADARLPVKEPMMVFSEGSPASAKRSESVTLETRLTDASGAPVSGAEVAFEIANAHAETTFTDDGGHAVVTMDAPADRGFVPVTASSSGPHAATASMILAITD